MSGEAGEALTQLGPIELVLLVASDDVELAGDVHCVLTVGFLGQSFCSIKIRWLGVQLALSKSKTTLKQPKFFFKTIQQVNSGRVTVSRTGHT